MNGILLALYGGTILLVVASYFLYPLAVWTAGRLFPPRFRREGIEPTVSVLIAAYNEEKDIARKIADTLAWDYPAAKLEILVGSDGSTDGTVEAARRALGERVSLFPFEVNRGKTSVQNDLVSRSHGEIIVFTDAASFVPPDALRKIVRNFADERVGCVAGRMRFAGTNASLTAQSQGLYWRYEVALRDIESGVGRLVGVDGPLYALRRECYVPLAANAISDLLTPLLVLQQGRRVVLEREAYVDEETKARAGEEFATRRRLALRGLVGLAMHRSILNPARDAALAAQVFLHKVVRWCVGPLVVLNVAACLALTALPAFRPLAVAYGVFFAAAIAGWASERAGLHLRALSVPYYFCLVNLAAGMGLVDFLRRKQSITWQPVRS